MLAKLQEKVNAHNEENTTIHLIEEETPNGVWEGDPGDGTDFIPVVDIPIEDEGVMPIYDMFDRPITQTQTPNMPNNYKAPTQMINSTLQTSSPQLEYWK